MKLIRFFLPTSVILVIAANLQAAPLPAKSEMTAVTVYTDRAVVTRSAGLELAAGVGGAPGVIEVLFEKLPAILLDQSLQVSGRGTAQVTILDVTARAVYVDFTPNERVKVIEDELRGLAKQRRVLDDRGAVLKSQESSLSKLETAATTAPNKDSAPRLTIEESAKFLTFLEEQRGKFLTERQSLDTQLEELAAKTEAAQRKLNELRGAGGRSFKTVTVRIDATTAGKLDLTLAYTVPGASWTPSYDARVNSNEKTIALAYHGLVRQNTGEDWKDVALTLSTARPGLGGAVPKLDPWGVDVFVPRPMPAAAPMAFGGSHQPKSRGARVNSNEKTIALAYHGLVRQNTGEDWKDVALTLSTARPGLGGAVPKLDPWGVDVFVPRPMPAAAPMAFGGSHQPKSRGVMLGAAQEGMLATSSNSGMLSGAAAAPMERSALTVAATVDSSATSSTFKVTASTTIPSDNSTQKVPIVTAALTANLEYLTTPKLQPSAFLAARVENASDFPFLAGTMNVFLDGTFVTTSALRTVMPGEKFDLALGADEGISVKHKRVQRFTEDTGLTSSGKRVTYEYILTLQNNKKTAARVIVADQIPVSRNEKIVVKQLAPDTKELKPAPDGTLKWTLDLKPAEKRELTLKFSIDHPNDVQVTGLEP